ncbi:hypothetical protein NitYY0918_C1611 [Nitratiruptor sp. YY09-18]|nr:hypothetical protein NitYY0918_C1611 [Nitratiruptor sp. YY09-18]
MMIFVLYLNTYKGEQMLKSMFEKIRKYFYKYSKINSIYAINKK